MKTGFLGLGAMGAHMARNLHRAGLLTAVWNRSTDKATALAAELGCLAPATPAQVAAACDVVVMCVSADVDVLITPLVSISIISLNAAPARAVAIPSALTPASANTLDFAY